MTKHTLLFFEKDSFYEYKEQKSTEGYIIISIGYFLINIADESIFQNFDYKSNIIDISALAAGYKEIQLIGEQVLNKFSEHETIFIADRKYEEALRYELRYCFDTFGSVEILDSFQQIKQNKKTEGKLRRITDLGEHELELFFQKFREKLYGHEKFKDDFEGLVKSFRIFNKLGEHKILSLFLMGESGVGKTEVARTIHECLDGKMKLAKVNFGNYSSEFSLSSLIGSARGYIGSDDGEIFIRVRNADVGVILIDEFEKSNATLFNYFLDVLESGKIISSLAEEIDLDGFIIVFTSNINKEDFLNRISPELRSRFDYKGLFTLLHNQDKRKFVEFRVKNIIRKFNLEFEDKLDESVYEYILSQINVSKYNNMRDLNKKIKRVFVEYVVSIQTAKYELSSTTQKPKTSLIKRILGTI